ncbi:hypothetical protein [Lyngbya confervoides]|uniref:Prepilin-type N-terminal cleavage/methylation domain-containing protein n=1 Tax=Lyngbya confervoides BDU141951 TaxID=1574623 RepID=A0ABD4SYQ8_9CYAN|nr:hypothetical protein [Lyngbya confervoides]MCM1981285.1 hypothetical protein [Lyngbya confervoides BDU141951]
MFMRFIKFLAQSPRNSQSPNQGFTTVEILVGVLLSAIFMAVAMQAIAVAAALRVKSQEASQAANWIQEDLNVVSAQAKALGGYDPVTQSYASVSTNRCAATTATDGYAALLQNEADNHPEIAAQDTVIGTDDTDPKFSSIGNRPYTLRRRTSIVASNPHVLRVQYDIYSGTDTTVEPLQSYYAEIIPGVAFACKQV